MAAARWAGVGCKRTNTPPSSTGMLTCGTSGYVYGYFDKPWDFFLKSLKNLLRFSGAFGAFFIHVLYLFWDGILGHQFNKSLESFPPCNAQSLLLADLKENQTLFLFYNSLQKKKNPRNKKTRYHEWHFEETREKLESEKTRKSSSHLRNFRFLLFLYLLVFFYKNAYVWLKPWNECRTFAPSILHC